MARESLVTARAVYRKRPIFEKGPVASFSLQRARMNEAPKCVVIVEDDHVFRRGLVKIFTKAKCRVFDFSNGQEASEHLASNAVDFVVCDYKLPGMNGLELLSKLRADSDEVPFVLVTAHYDDELRSAAVKAGALDAMSKPLDLEGLTDLFTGSVSGA